MSLAIWPIRVKRIQVLSRQGCLGKTDAGLEDLLHE